MKISIFAFVLLLSFGWAEAIGRQVSNSSAGTTPIDIGTRKQLFIDRRFITADWGIKLNVNPPTKSGFVMVPEKPWELGWIVGYGTVLEDGGKYRMWYSALPPGKIDQIQEESFLCYAESPDGINWTKPDLGIFEWRGSKANNIVLQASIESTTVFIDPKAPAAERYKLLVTYPSRGKIPPGGGGTGMYIYTSPDGLRWKFHPTLLFPFAPDTQNQAFYDDRLGKYVIYVRQWKVPETRHELCCRQVGRIETDDIMAQWPYTKGLTPKMFSGKDKTPFPTGEVATAFGFDKDDPPSSDPYTSAAVQYPWAADAYLMFPSAYLHYPDPPKGKFRNDGPVDIQLAVSRDGVSYSRPERKPYVELGPEGTQDGGSIYMLVGIARRGDEIYQYYSGYPFTHGAYHALQEEVKQGAIIRLTQRLDGFVSADADMTGGSFATPPLKFEGSKLVLNMNASGMGEVRVELQDETGKPLAGYAFADCDPLYLNNVRKTVTWKGKTDVSTLSGKPLRVAFQMRAAKLYAFQFER